MNLWNNLIGKSKQITLNSEGVKTIILDLPSFYREALNKVMEDGKDKDPISYVNQNLITICPRCGVNYNDNGFEIGLLASLSDGIKQGIPTTFLSANNGIYPRCIKGICPNPKCSSRIANIKWIGDNIEKNREIKGTLRAIYIFKNGGIPLSKKEYNSILNSEPSYHKDKIIETRAFNEIPKDQNTFLTQLTNNVDEEVVKLIEDQIATYQIEKKNDLMVIKVIDTFYLKEPPGFFIIAFILKVGAQPSDNYCSNLVASDSAYKPGRAGIVQMHPISGWDRSELSSSQIFNLLLRFHPDIKDGIHRNEIFYDFRKVDKDHLLVRIFGSKYWNDYISNQ